MYVVRGAAWVLALVSVLAVSLSLVLAGRNLSVDPDLGQRGTVVLPAHTAAPPGSSTSSRDRDGNATLEPDQGARTDPKPAVPVEPHDESDDRARDAADRARDAAEDQEDAGE